MPCVDVLFVQSLENKPQVFSMFCYSLGKYQDVINENNDKVIQMFSEDVLHKMHEL